MIGFIKVKALASLLFWASVLLNVTEHAIAQSLATTITTQPITIMKPALTENFIGEALTGWIESPRQRVGDGGAWGSFGLTISAQLTNINYSENGRNYSVYQINDPSTGESSGVGFILNTITYDCLFIFPFGCLSDTQSGPFAQAAGNDYQEFRSGVLAYLIDYQYSIKLIALSKNIPRGTFSVSPQQVGFPYLPAYDRPALTLSGFSITYEQTGCIASVSPSILGMGVVSPLDFSGVGSTVSGNLSATVNLQCDDGLGVYASMTDQNNIGNSDSILSLSQSTGNAATGVGVRFVRDDNSVVSYGPSSSFVDPTSTSQWQVKSKSDSNNSFSFTLRPEYIQTEPSITAGDANALVSITFAYD